MASIIDPQDNEAFDAIRDMASLPGVRIGAMFSFLRLFENMRRQDLEIPRKLLESGQRHLELDETTLESTGDSVSVDEVIARIDEALDA